VAPPASIDQPRSAQTEAWPQVRLPVRHIDDYRQRPASLRPATCGIPDATVLYLVGAALVLLASVRRLG
jgi:hypothetical protein